VNYALQASKCTITVPQVTYSACMKKHKTLLCLAMVLAFAQTHALSQQTSTTATAGAKDKEPIRIGAIFPLTGGSSDMGNSARIGAQVAVDQINLELGGLLGRKVVLVVRDDAATPDTGLKQAEDLVLKEKVHATVGFCNSGVAMKSLDVFQNNKHPLLVTCATGSAITSKYPAVESYIFRTSARDQLQSQFLVDDLVLRKLKKVALLVDDSGYGDAGLKDLEAALAKAGLKAHMVVRFKVGVKTLVDEIKQLKDSGADALIGWTVGPEQGVIAAGKAAVKWDVPQLGPWGLSHASAYSTSNGAVNGAVMVQTVLPNPGMERHASFLRGYAKLSKETPIGSMMSAAQTYDAVNLLLRAMFYTPNDLSGSAIKNELENISKPYYGVVTTYTSPFSNKDHDAISANMLWLGTWRNGERAYAYKDDAAKAVVVRRKQ
jgi:branched-chain amino acid transport system substrate-binding protein